MRSLWKITDEIKTLEAVLDDADEAGEGFSEAATKQLGAYLDGLAEDQERKLDGYGWWIRSMEADAAVCRAEAEHFRAKAKSLENRTKWAKDKLMEHMTSVGQRKIATGRFTFAIQRNGGLQPVVVYNEDEIPEQYLETRVIVRQSDVQTALVAGKEVPGAKLLERGEHLRVR